MEKLTESINGLDLLVQEKHSFYKRINDQIQVVIEALIAEIDIQIKQHPDQLFVLSAKGSFEKTIGYGPRSNMTRDESFNLYYVGLTGEGAIKDLSDGNKIKALLMEQNYLLPYKVLYSMDAVDFGFKNEDQALYLHSRNHQFPGWTIQDLMRQYISKEIAEAVFTDDTKYATVSLAIGDEAVKSYFKEKEDAFMRQMFDRLLREVLHR